ncbi:MAG: hypothetical protein HN849_21845 [Victivallales bacterium]|jgi:hypothetical protein|nr:hypothetical protein [Victivallales bacterium]MBT7163854.1 hypothetical protein [Victivallales bacterium]MBT7302186.1 hypothetical protein [Victivallales bacterium]
MDERTDMARVLEKLDRLENSLRQTKKLLVLLIAVVVVGFLGVYGIVAVSAYLLFIGALLCAGVYLIWWLMWGLARLKSPPRSDERLRLAILAKEPGES